MIPGHKKTRYNVGPSTSALFSAGKPTFKPGDMIMSIGSYYYANSKGLTHSYYDYGHDRNREIMICMAVVDKIDPFYLRWYPDGPWYMFMGPRVGLMVIGRQGVSEEWMIGLR